MAQSTADDYWHEIQLDDNAKARIEPLVRFATPAEQVIGELRRNPSLNIGDAQIDFNAKTWDFSACTTLPNKKNLRITFKCHRYDGIVRVWLLYALATRSAKIQSLIQKDRTIEKLCVFADEKGIADLSLLKSETIEEFLRQREQSCNSLTVSGEAKAISDFLEFYGATVAPLSDAGVQRALDHRHHHRARRVCGSFEPIPQAFLVRMISVCERVCRDEAEPLSDRITACAILIMSQTGMRTCELIDLSAKAISVSRAPVEGELDIPYITFRSPKPAKGDGQWVEAKCIMNKVAYDAFGTAMEICRDARERKGIPSLIVYDRQKGRHISDSALDLRYKRFLLAHRSEIPCVNTDSRFPELASAPITTTLIGSEARAMLYPDISIGRDVLVYPRLRQFRSTVATELERRGVDWRFIQTQMSHLNMDSMNSYIYDREDATEQCSEAVYRLVFGKGGRMLGKHATEFMDKVESFLSENNLNAVDDLEGVVAAAAGKFPLREKLGGICIRCGQVVPCSDDSQTDRLLCAFGACPNHCHFFFNIAQSYELAKERALIIEENLSKGWIKAARNEQRKLWNLLDDSLMPELGELEREIERQGIASILEQYPDLKEIAPNIDVVKEEIALWQRK